MSDHRLCADLLQYVVLGLAADLASVLARFRVGCMHTRRDAQIGLGLLLGLRQRALKVRFAGWPPPVNLAVENLFGLPILQVLGGLALRRCWF